MKVRMWIAVVPAVAASMGFALADDKPAAPRTRPAKVNITISKETTWITAPLNPDGTVNYVAYLNAKRNKGVTPENNAAVLLLKALGPKALDEDKREAILKALKVGPLPADRQYFIRHYEYAPTVFPGRGDSEEAMRAAKRIEKSYEKALNEPILPKDHPELVEWLRTNERPLSLVRAAVKRPRFFLPLVSRSDPPTMQDTLLASSMGGTRGAGKAMLVRAMVSAGRGDAGGAMDDLIAIRRLAGHMGRDGNLIDFLVMTSLDMIASDAVIRLATSGKLPAAQGVRYLRRLQNLPSLPTLTSIMDGAERIPSLDMIIVFAREGLDRGLKHLELTPGQLKSIGLETATDPLPNVELDWDLMLRLANARSDEIIRIGHVRPLAKRRRAFALLRKRIARNWPGVVTREECEVPWEFRKEIGQAIDSIGTKDQGKLTKAVFEVFFAAGIMERLYVLQDRARMQRQLAQVALALAVYKSEHGTYPKTPGGLTPNYLKRIPKDIFTGQPLIYRREAKGYVLSCLGENLKDDRGEPDDIVVRAKQ